MKHVVVLVTLLFLPRGNGIAQVIGASVRSANDGIGRVVQVDRYVQLRTGNHVIDPGVGVSLDKSEASQLKIFLLRDSLSHEDGAQYLKIVTSVTNRNDRTLDDNTQFTITFSRQAVPAEDTLEHRRFGREIDPIGHTNPALIETVPIQVDTLAEWGHLYITVEPEQEFVKYYGRIKNKLEFDILVKGSTIEAGLTVSVPKVLYDTRGYDSVAYGKTSAMLRLYFLNAETGMRYPLNFGLGTFGVDSPIDVSRTGGGFAASFYFDVVQLFRMLDYNVSYGFNAGFDVSPFFPIGRKARVLFNARLGISP